MRDLLNKQLPEILIVGFINKDINIYPGNIHEVMLGGGGYISHLGCSLICDRVALVSRIGTDVSIPHDSMMQDLRGIKISCSPTSTSIQTYLDPHDLSIREIALLAGASSEVCFEDIPQEWLGSCRFIHLSTMPVKQQQNILEKIAAHATSKKFISLDTDISLIRSEESLEILTDLISKVDLVFLNRFEFELLGDRICSHKLVVKKNDAQGASIIEHGLNVLNYVPARVDCVDPTGAGDIFAGVFLGKLLLTSDLAQSLKSAVDIASKSVAKRGVLHLTGYDGLA